ncbi:hypothetical protein ARMGADRAFT_213464 [Armillaria gallica]|uniref:Uncharacterized protein n=1 Tax=Armillaria gallica TaxID=47427 RepID=A0A2H3DC20_ARMGA|nr:hypothetical protein ARMGADRAFT_213464 [Armillaria gallica]
MTWPTPGQRLSISSVSSRSDSILPALRQLFLGEEDGLEIQWRTSRIEDGYHAGVKFVLLTFSRECSAVVALLYTLTAGIRVIKAG